MKCHVPYVCWFEWKIEPEDTHRSVSIKKSRKKLLISLTYTICERLEMANINKVRETYLYDFMV